MTRRNFLAVSGAAAVHTQAAQRKPNIIFILADDLGYGDLGCYGQQKIRTPNLDRMAAEGTRFTQAYSGSTVCAPSRCCLMTGKHTGHATVRGNLRPEAGLAEGEVTVATLLKRAGYRTALFGKWGLGGPGTGSVPNSRGFDEFYGYLDQLHAHTSYPEHLWDNQNEVFLTENWFDQRKTFSQRPVHRAGARFHGQADRAVLPLPDLYHPARQQRARHEDGRRHGEPRHRALRLRELAREREEVRRRHHAHGPRHRARCLKRSSARAWTRIRW